MQKSFPLFECLVKRAILLFVLGHFINFFITRDALRGHTISKNGFISCYLHPPPPPIEGFCVYPYQKYLLLLKTPSEIKIKVPTHSPLGKKKEFKDTDIHAPSAQKLLFKTPSPGLQITNGQAPVTLSGQTCFCSDTTRFWPVKFY